MEARIQAPLRVELTSKDAFWQRAVLVEWTHQYPERTPRAEAGNVYVIEEAWRDDFARVAQMCFSTIVTAPPDPGRRRLFRRLLATDARR